MSNRRNQRLPEEIYVRRRVAAAAIILVLVALLVWGLVALNRGSDDEGGTSPAPTTTAEASPASDASAASAAADETTETVEASGVADPAATETTATESSEESEESEATEASGTSGAPESAETTSSEATTKPKDSCELSDLRITATSDQPSYAPDVQPTFYMTVDNPTAADCEIDLDENVLRFEVYDMKTNQRMWADTDCYPSVEDGTRTFPAGEERHFEAVWSRLGSAPGQCTNRRPVPEGSYYLHGVIGQNPSNAHSFNLG